MVLNFYEVFVARYFLFIVFANIECFGQRRDGQTPAPNSGQQYGQQYGQWGHYINYDSRNRPLEWNNPYGSGNVRGFTPDPNRMRLIEEPGDMRCKEAINSNLNEFVTVNTMYGNVVGRFVYMCDAPGVPERDRPLSVQNRPTGLGAGFRPLNRFWLNVTTFLGIPYARPPLREDNLRFKPPQVPSAWGSIMADKYRNSCPQFNRYVKLDYSIPMIDEDCLYLNIFTPWASSLVRTPYPVMIYIHGGNYDHGSGNTFPGHMLAASQQVVVVTFNYRLGLLGFLATADNSSAGNYGMLDQVQAINWVRENIRQFNGDPEKIALFGPGAGAASAGLLAMSPLTRKSIRRVIAQSGAAVSDWAFIRDHLTIRNNSVVAGYTYGCRVRHTASLVDCLRSRTLSDIKINEVKPDIGWLPWGPVIDSPTRDKEYQFMPDYPEVLLTDGRVQFHPDFAYMSGITRDEGSAFLFADDYLKKNNYHITKEMFNRKVKEYINIYNYTLDQEALIRAINYAYAPWNDPDNATLIRQGLIEMLTDSWFTAGNDKMVKLLLQNNVRTFMYVLNYTIEGLKLPDWMGVPHDTEYLFASGAPFMDPRFFPPALKLDHVRWTEADRNMSQLFMESWGNFVKGEKKELANPTPTALFNIMKWQPMTLKNLQYLVINSTNYTTNVYPFYHGNTETMIPNTDTMTGTISIMWRDYRQKACRFWNDYIPALVQRERPTWPPTFEPYEVELRIYRAATWSIMAALIVLLCLTILCSCLYCRAKSDRYGDAAIGDYIDIPDIATMGTMGTQYSAPSTRANSEVSLSAKNKSDYPRKYKPASEKLISNNKHTQV